MAKKTNALASRARFAKKMSLEQMKNRDQVNMYGGLGKVGLDYADRDKRECLLSDEELSDETDEQAVAAFSNSAKALIRSAAAKEGAEEEEDEMLCEGFDTMALELQKIDDEVEEDPPVDPNDLDKAAFAIPETDEGYRKILKERFGHDEFMEGQLEAIKVLVQKRSNALVVLATGGGKSLVYQYVTQFMPGLVLVVTPLIALMTDQLNKLPDFLPGACLNSQQKYQTKQQVVTSVQEKNIKVLFITPERLFTEDLNKFGRKISMVCVDEIHCASEWSHNFRPTYLMLHEMVKEKLGKKARVLGLTATATRSTQRQICRIFDVKYPEHLVTQPDLSRLNLQLAITRDKAKDKALMTLLRSDGYRRLSSILLFATQRRTTEQVAAFLNAQGISAAAYHAGKTDE